MNELTYFVIAAVVALFLIYLIVKLADKAKLRRLQKKFPEGTETVAKSVSRLDEVPTTPKEVAKVSENKKAILTKLLPKKVAKPIVETLVKPVVETTPKPTPEKPSEFALGKEFL